MYLCCVYKPTFCFMGIQRHRQYPRVTLKIYHGLSLYLYLSYVFMSYSDLTWIIWNLWRFWGTWGFKVKSIGFCKGPLSCFARSWNHVDVVGRNGDVCSRPSASTLKSQTFATNKKRTAIRSSNGIMLNYLWISKIGILFIQIFTNIFHTFHCCQKVHWNCPSFPPKEQRQGGGLCWRQLPRGPQAPCGCGGGWPGRGQRSGSIGEGAKNWKTGRPKLMEIDWNGYMSVIIIITSSAAQGGGGSFKDSTL